MRSGFLFIALLCICLAHFGQAPGSLDLSFGQNGIREVHISGSDRAHAIACDAQDHLYIGGYTIDYSNGPDPDYSLLKLRPDGSLDSSFGIGAVIRSDFPGFQTSRIMDVQVHDQNLYLLGEANNPGNLDTQAVFIGKMDLDGNWDANFADQGLYRVQVRKPFTEGSQMEILQDGRIVVLGTAVDTVAFHTDLPMLLRLLPNGVPDSSFGGTGIVLWNFASGFQSGKTLHTDGAQALGLCARPSQYVVGGYYYESAYAKGFLMAVDSNGQALTAFGDAGIQIIDFNPGLNNGITDIVWDGSRYYLGGTADVFWGGEDMALLSMDSLGHNLQYDPVDFSGREDHLQDLIVDPFGKVIFAGLSRESTNDGLGYESDAFAVGALEAPADLADNFGQHGQSWLPLGLPNDQSGADAIVALSDGSLVAVGFRNDTTSGNFSDLLLAKYHNGPSVSIPVPESSLPAPILIYPNPTQGALFIQGFQNPEMQLFNSLGQQVWDGRPNQGKINLPPLPSGCYFLKVDGAFHRIVQE